VGLEEGYVDGTRVGLSVGDKLGLAVGVIDGALLAIVTPFRVSLQSSDSSFSSMHLQVGYGSVSKSQYPRPEHPLGQYASLQNFDACGHINLKLDEAGVTS